jgi:hypothetical protein
MATRVPLKHCLLLCFLCDETIWQEKNQEKLLATFYGLIPPLGKLLKCDEYRIANLVLIQLPDFFVAIYKTSTMNKTQDDTPATLEPS